MSYLNNTRLVFSGTFQADVSTVNNDVRHFDNATFESRFQEMQSTTENGWWNPVGSGAFRLIDCRIRGVHYGDGTGTADPARDFVVGLTIGGANDRVAAKLVDLDPQWQMASEIWGLQVHLADVTGSTLVKGNYLTTAFRDIAFGRVDGVRGSGGASSSFQSVLAGTDWGARADESRVLRELRAAATGGSLSLRLMTFAYVGRYGAPRFSLGTVSGVMGPAVAGEPNSFVLGRRFVPKTSAKSWNGINYFTASIDRVASTLLLDLGNALPLQDTKGTMRDIGTLSVGVLQDPSLTERQVVTAMNFESFGEIDYKQEDWLLLTGGIHAIALTPQQLEKARTAPLALVTRQSDGTSLVAMRESTDGLFSRAEEFVQRIDAPGRAAVSVYAAQYGEPLAEARIALSLQPPIGGLGAGNPDAPDQPKAPVPDIGTPADALQLPASVVADAKGRATVGISTTSPGNPRGYIDGQIYLIDYSLDGEDVHSDTDQIIVHARDAFDVRAKPAWLPDIAPIFTQYGNLYPIMSQRLVDLSDPEAVRRHLKILQLAFSLDIDNPNYMPVTRDLSQNKRITVQRWLARLESEDDPTFGGGPRRASEDGAAAEASVAESLASQPTEGKPEFALSLRRGLTKSK